MGGHQNSRAPLGGFAFAAGTALATGVGIGDLRLGLPYLGVDLSAAIPLFALLHQPARRWSRILFFAFFVQLLVRLLAAPEAWRAIVETVESLSVSLLVALLLDAFRARPGQAPSVGATLRFAAALVLGAMGGTLVARGPSLLLGVMEPSLLLVLSWVEFALGLAATLPFMVALRRRAHLGIDSRHRALEAVFLLLLCGLFLFLVLEGTDGARSRALLLLVPIFVWSSSRFGRAWATGGNLAFVLVVGRVDLLSSPNLAAAISRYGFVLLVVIASLCLSALLAERDEALRRIRLSEARLSGVLASIPEVVLRVDAQGRCLEKLGVAERFRTGADPRITSVSSLLSPEAARDVLALVRRVLEDGRGRGGRTRDRWEGQERWTEARVVRICGLPRRTDTSIQEAEAESALVTLRDVTDEHLGQQRAAAEEKMQALQKLTGGVAHDFNNLLTTILGNLELLRSDVRAKESFVALEDVARAAGRARELTQHLLAYSERQPLQPQPLHLPTFLASLEVDAASELEAVDILHPENRGPWTICVDPDGLRSALLSLVANARDATGPGQWVRIRADRRQVKEEPGEAPRSCVCIRVEDDGEGMPPSTLSRACDPFFTTRGIERSGLGLSMVRGFARQSGGYFQLRSKEGEGTRAALLLPLFELPTEEGRTFSGPGSVVVVADRDAAARRLAGRQVARLGYLPFEVASPRELEGLLERIGNVALTVVDADFAAMEGFLSARDQARLWLAAPGGPSAPDTVTKPLTPSALRRGLELFLTPRAATPLPELQASWPVDAVTSAWSLEPPDLGPRDRSLEGRPKSEV